MIKKCKITNITNGIIYGVVKDTIRNGNILDLNSGQILRCMLEASVDEILSDNTLVRLNKTNYNKNNEKKKVNILEENKDTKVPEKAIADTETPIYLKLLNVAEASPSAINMMGYYFEIER